MMGGVCPGGNPGVGLPWLGRCGGVCGGGGGMGGCRRAARVWVLCCWAEHFGLSVVELSVVVVVVVVRDAAGGLPGSRCSAAGQSTWAESGGAPWRREGRQADCLPGLGALILGRGLSLRAVELMGALRVALLWWHLRMQSVSSDAGQGTWAERGGAPWRSGRRADSLPGLGVSDPGHWTLAECGGAPWRSGRKADFLPGQGCSDPGHGTLA